MIAEFTTALICTEDLINSRPIGQASTHLGDRPIITPNSFLRAPLAGQLGPVGDQHWTIGKRWTVLQSKQTAGLGHNAPR